MISPRATLWLVFSTTVFQGLSTGTYLSGILPAEWVHFATALANLITFINLSFLTVFVGYAGPGVGPLAKPPTVAQAHDIMVQAQQEVAKNNTAH